MFSPLVVLSEAQEQCRAGGCLAKVRGIMAGNRCLADDDRDLAGVNKGDESIRVVVMFQGLCSVIVGTDVGCFHTG